MTSKPGEQTVTIDILPRISRSEGNQTMKLGNELFECVWPFCEVGA